MKLRVLFVGEKPEITSEFQRSFLNMADEWEMKFATGVQEVIYKLAEDQVDVLVADLRMDTPEGPSFLELVRSCHPHTVRIVLTGPLSRDTMIRLVPLAHRFLGKPCDSKTLKTTIAGVCALREVLHGEKLKSLIGKLGNLPTPAGQSAQILAELDSPDSSLLHVGKMIGRDVGLSTKLLQLANSSLFGLRHPATSPPAAVQALGVETTKAVLLMSAASDRFDLKTNVIGDIWEHSRLVGIVAGRIARMEGGGDQIVVAQVAGILHDVGRLALACLQKDSYREVLKMVTRDKIAITAAEKLVFGATHAEVGAYLIGLWGLQHTFIEVVAWHHNPAGSMAETFSPVLAVHAAESMLAPEEGGDFDFEYLKKLGLEKRFPLWKEQLDTLA